ncbi:two-component system sensor histidine kinase CreC [Ostreibacterium oceani]|uniref:histidine kinase n=1 Tax=Ostreibacterium oceani TaxID=2654998 RepID=A0A6N7ESF8_9GAMM|nr:two-component system sensor histidine kinase CreC [Ostreibacterium oceani]MPV85432.1 two-component system sensor histidine kinase CreC [Ostreibacterium oceani]
MMKMSFSFRAFVVYFIVIGGLSWFILDKASDKLKTAFQQSSETVLVDTANLLATFLEHEFRDQVLDTAQMSQLFEDSYKRRLNATIYSLYKDEIDLEIYVTNRQGVVVYDSTNRNEGKDFSQWRDVNLTLQGQYGARSSFRYDDKTAEGDEKIMVVAAPIRIDNEIVGVLSVVKPIRPLEQLLAVEIDNLKDYALLLVTIAIVLAYLVSYGFTHAISRLVNYANRMTRGQKTPPPRFLDKRFDKLAKAMTQMREELDGKEYVEHYIHGLTHELKTPLTAVGAAAELLAEGVPQSEQLRFINNIQISNQRMQKLVERMLDLAKLESKNKLDIIDTFDLSAVVEQLLSERASIIQDYGLAVAVEMPDTQNVSGDSLLIRQAIANLLDNALENAPDQGDIILAYRMDNNRHHLQVINEGVVLEDYVLDRAFERFFSLQSNHRLHKSTGLGLSFVREIMSLHDGEAYLKNTKEGVCAGIIWP